MSKTQIIAVALLCTATALISPAQTLTTLHQFDVTDGDLPRELIQATDGNFYGTAYGGGTNSHGTVFKITAGGMLSTLYNFNGSDGSGPWGLVEGTDGNFYGTTTEGGNSGNCSMGCGTVFRITPGGMLTSLHSFANGTDGACPFAGLVQATDGNFYGTTSGCYGAGTIFRITPDGNLTTLYTFCSQPHCSDGAIPEGQLVQATDGSLYGTTNGGGHAGCLGGCGTVFRITLSGNFTSLYSFCNQANCPDGSNPSAALVQGTDGNLYGTTQRGGGGLDYCGNGCGTVFEITTSGTLTTLHAFGGPDGGFVTAGLVQGTDGNFYGTTSQNGSNDSGTIFRMTPSGSLSTLYSFCSQPECTDGANPAFALVQAIDGNLYGITQGGGTNNPQCSSGCGTVFSLSVGIVLSPVQFVPTVPCRLVDTRQGNPIPGGAWRVFAIPQLGGCNIPTTAAAYSLNVTLVPQQHHRVGYLTIWPAERPQPNVSTMNSPDGRVKANAAIVPAGASAAVSVYVTDTTDVILDINGYFEAPGSQTYQFFSVRPCRLVDTRNNHNGGTLQAGTERDYNIAGHCNIPTTATAYSFNVTVVPNNGALDYLTVWPKGVTRPTVSTLNDPKGIVVANAAIVPAGQHDTTAFYAHNNSTDLILDVNGYFAPAGTGGLSLYPVAPCRVLDTRSVGSGQGFNGDWNPPDGVNVVASPCAPPSNSKAFVFNATVVPPAPLPFLTLWPHGQSQPNVSTLNSPDGSITSNMAIVPTNDGSIDAYAAALTQLILDISGYFAP